MTDEQKPKNEADAVNDEADGDVPVDPEDSAAIRALLKRSMDVGASASSNPDLLRGVQKKLRQRSMGKFYADGWSTSPSRINYGLIAVAMLIVIAVAYFALGPTGFSAH